jgi:acetoin utilization deacetylase AcuC-like enzyme
VDVLLLSHPEMGSHAPIGGHPESPARLAAALAGVRTSGVGLVERDAREATRAELERVHPASYLNALGAVDDPGGWLDPDTWIGPGSLRAARLAAGAACEAVDEVLGGRATTAFCAVRPPGHHAASSHPMGFCLTNAAAVAAEAARAGGTARICILDWDVHHGNGTQDVFVEDPDVLVLSLHQRDLWPFSGREDERGAGAGAGATRNITFPRGTGPADYLARFEAEALPALERHRPALVLVSSGFDAHRDDPLGGLGLEDATYAALTRATIEACRRVGAAGPVVLLEGGYDLGALERSARMVVRELGGAGISP